MNYFITKREIIVRNSIETIRENGRENATDYHKYGEYDLESQKFTVCCKPLYEYDERDLNDIEVIDFGNGEVVIPEYLFTAYDEMIDLAENSSVKKPVSSLSDISITSSGFLSMKLKMPINITVLSSSQLCQNPPCITYPNDHRIASELITNDIFNDISADCRSQSGGQGPPVWKLNGEPVYEIAKAAVQTTVPIIVLTGSYWVKKGGIVVGDVPNSSLSYTSFFGVSNMCELIWGAFPSICSGTMSTGNPEECLDPSTAAHFIDGVMYILNNEKPSGSIYKDAKLENDYLIPSDPTKDNFWRLKYEFGFWSL
jgi:hypothetical protein